MGCAATKSSNIVEPSPSKKPNSPLQDENNNEVKQRAVKSPKKAKDQDSLRGSKASLRSTSTASRSDRESSAQSTRTADSGFGGGDNERFISENSTVDEKSRANVDERPVTPELCIEGSQVPRRQSGKDRKKLSSLDALPPITGQSLVQRPQSRAGNLAFDITLDTVNIKKRPGALPKLEKRKSKKIMTKEELEEKMKRAEERRKNHEQKLVAKSQSLREHQLRSALEFARTQEEVTEEDNDF